MALSCVSWPRPICVSQIKLCLNSNISTDTMLREMILTLKALIVCLDQALALFCKELKGKTDTLFNMGLPMVACVEEE